MNPSRSSTLTRAVIISGITFNLSKHLKRPLLVKLSIDGTDARSVLLRSEEGPTGARSLQEPLNLLDGAILSVQVLEKHRFQADRTLAHLNLSLNKLWGVQGPGHAEGYLVELPDPKQQLWLNITVITPSPQPCSNELDTAPQLAEKVPHHQRTARAMENATKSLRSFETTFEQLGGAKLEKGVKIAQAIGELHSTAKIVVQFVKIVYEEFKTHDQHHKDLLDLSDSMERMLKFIPAAEEVAELTVLKDTIKSFYELMDKTVEFVKKWLDIGGISKIINVSESQTQIEDLKKQYNAFEKSFDRGVAVDHAIKIDYVAKSQELEELKARLGGITEVQPRASPCMDGTRIDILSDIEQKTSYLDNKNVIWIHGAPGSGKSAVSLTLKLRLHKQGRLVTYFRFDRNNSAVTTSTALWLHVAYNLADRYTSVRKNILSLLRENKVDLTSTMDLFTSLVEEPLSKFANPPPDNSLVIVVDALDECDGSLARSSDRRALLQTLGRWPRLPKYFKLVVTSRDEGSIGRTLSLISTSVEIPSGNSVIDNPHISSSLEASKDIRAFLESRFLDIRERYFSSCLDWPGEDSIAHMVRRAAGNFMWATAASIFIESGGLDPQEQLKAIMRDAPGSINMNPLYPLYSTILEAAFGNIADNSPDAEVLRVVLGAMIIAKRPLLDNEYIKLPTTKPVTIIMLNYVRDGLRSVVAPGALRFIHKSFDDFLLSKDCPPMFAVQTDEAQRVLAELCLTTMTTELCFNICHLETSCLKNMDVPDIETKVRDGVSSLLSYSCRFWTDHLVNTPLNAQLMVAVKDMIFNKLLFWFEVMSLLKEINRVSYSLLSVLKWCNLASDTDLKDFIHDARQFIRAFIYPIAQSAPHIYITALPFAPEHSLVAQRFLPQCPLVLQVSVGKPTDWSPCVFTSEHHSAVVYSVVFSPDEKYFVSGSFDCSICVCDSETGNLVSGPFRASDMVMSSFFSPDGRRVWASCRDGQVIGWDIETGEKHVDFRVGEECWDIICCCSNGGRNIVSASRKKGTVTLWNAETGEQLYYALNLPSDDRDARVSFSPDGCYMAWARWSDTIRIWNLAEGSEIPSSSFSQPYFTHKENISTLSFSVDGHFVVSGSENGTILIWNANTGDIVGRPLATGKHRVAAVAYCHENRLLVSALGDSGTLTGWNASTHEVVVGPLPGHTSGIYKITLSHDGRRALSASHDHTLRMWDLERAGVMPMAHAIEGHNNPVRWVAFSPCGKRVASCDSGAIQLWDAGTGKPLLSSIDLSVSKFNGILPCFGATFSPDGSQIIAFRFTKYYAIHAWSVSTGELVFSYNLGDGIREWTDPVPHVAFRSTDQRLVTCSREGDVHLWILEDGYVTEDLSVSTPQPEDPTEPVEIIALSPDGLTAIVRDKKRTPCHYMWSTTTSQILPSIFPDDKHVTRGQVEYSPNGKLFAAGSKEGALLVWNTQTGELVAGPTILDSQLWRLAFSPDDGQIAFVCYSPEDDGTSIRIMNARTGILASEPWKAHSERIVSLAFSPDGKRLVSGSWGSQIGIWNTADLLGDSQASSGFLGVRTHMQDGWVMDTGGKLLFWVPKEHRSALVWSRNIVMIGGRGIRTELDLTKFGYGVKWMECFEGRL